MAKIVTPDHAHELGYCNTGLRLWFPETDVTFEEFRKNGVTVEWLRSHDNVMCQRLADYVESLPD